MPGSSVLTSIAAALLLVLPPISIVRPSGASETVAFASSIGGWGALLKLVDDGSAKLIGGRSVTPNRTGFVPVTVHFVSVSRVVDTSTPSARTASDTTDNLG